MAGAVINFTKSGIRLPNFMPIIVFINENAQPIEKKN